MKKIMKRYVHDVISIVEGVPFAESPFTVSSDGNVLTNNFNLDWETRNFYQFTIRATDGGSPPMTVRKIIKTTIIHEVLVTCSSGYS